METKKEEIVKEGTVKENTEKNMYEKITNLIKSLLPKQEESASDKEISKESSEIQEYKNQINEYKRLLKENESLNLLKSYGLDKSLKDLITYHPNPKEAAQALKAFKDENLKSAASYTPQNLESKAQNSLNMFLRK